MLKIIADRKVEEFKAYKLPRHYAVAWFMVFCIYGIRIAYPMTLKYFKGNGDDDEEEGETNAHSWRFLGKHAPAEHNGTNNLLYVKDVWVKIDRSCLRDAELGLQLLDNSWSSSYTFPSARRLKIEYYDAGCGYDTSSAEVEDEVIAVIIKRAFSQLPKLQEVYIACTVNSEHVDNREYQSIIAHGIDKVLTMAFLKTKRLNINGINLWMAKSPLHMYGGVGLTHLVLRGNHNAGIYQHIIKRNAPTLNTLVVQSGLYSAVQDLLIDEGNIIIYPRLETLELDYFPDDENAPGHKIDKAVAPFPNLNRLCWDGLYPFSDDTLFRGNSSTLTYLSMDMRGKLLQIAQEYKIFYQGSHPKLRHIISTDCYGDPTSEHLDTPTYLQFTLDLVSPSTQTLGLNTLYKAQTFLREIPQYPHMLNIQVLNMYDSELTLSDIINLLKQLPNLTYLETNFGGIGAEIEEIDFNNLINQPYSLHYPLK
ncbi:hypothetical protein GGI26_004873 [Coemansia sp. RSA 1358]|uniref:Uncharacterized protein n=1 Tax=Coemansia umbellata TaxID=1424467 RepID=A0ABQ8PI61_9FUNG|nr:hypothetical protein EDC05_004573 [Coemansia umbellata]KAJ2620584.1 hypothetical protein GGI26_004873 [Coemansia sp. RSA 1358]